jgi:uncharacterized protein
MDYFINFSYRKASVNPIIIMVLLLLVIVSACSTSTQNYTMNIAVMTKTGDFRHGNIPVAVEALQQMATQNKWKLFHTEDSLYFSPASLDTLDLVIFLQTTDDIFGADQQQAIQAFVENGGGLLTLHTGTVTENNWDWYMEMMGARFIGHPPVQKGRLIIEDRTHPATSFLPDSIWIIEDEWYSFDRNPRSDVNVLISIDESSYDMGNNDLAEGAGLRMGDHPMVWYRYAGKGRVFQTALGHPAELYSDPLFLKHIHGAIVWTAGMENK